MKASVMHAPPDFIKDEGESDARETSSARISLEFATPLRQQFCALEYVSQLNRGAERAIKQIILVVVRQADGVLQFLAHPNLHEVVEVTNLTYVLSLLEEFLVSAKDHAEQLFRQLCSLASGPLLPYKVGEQIDDYPDIREVAMQFMPL